MTTKRGIKDGHFLSSLPLDVAMKKLLLLLSFVSLLRDMILLTCFFRIITRIHGSRGLSMADLSRIRVFSPEPCSPL